MNNMEKTENINQMTENTLFMIQNNLFMSLMRGLMSRTYSHWSQRLKNHNIRTWRTWSWVRSRWENIKWNVEPWIEMDEMEMVWNGEKIGKITFWTQSGLNLVDLSRAIFSCLEVCVHYGPSLRELCVPTWRDDNCNNIPLKPTPTPPLLCTGM